MSNLPTEIVDMILVFLNDIDAALELKRNSVIKNIYDPQVHTPVWACEHGNLAFLKWLKDHTNVNIVNDRYLPIIAAIKGNGFT
jgi:hypothetical protein